MTWAETVRTGWEAIAAHRLRSGLTALGILIGIAAVVLTVGLGEGAQQQVGAQIQALGSNLLVVAPGSSTSTSGVRGGSGTADTLTTDDAQALAAGHASAPDIAAVAPTVQRSLSLTAGTANWTTSVVGTTPPWAAVRARTVSEGRFLTTADVASSAAVTVLAPTTAQELFGRLDPVGQTVDVDQIPFQVVGVLASAGSDSTTSLDDQALVPLTTAQTRLIGGTARDAVQTIYLQARTAADLSGAAPPVDAVPDGADVAATRPSAPPSRWPSSTPSGAGRPRG